MCRAMPAGSATYYSRNVEEEAVYGGGERRFSSSFRPALDRSTEAAYAKYMAHMKHPRCLLAFATCLAGPGQVRVRVKEG